MGFTGGAGCDAEPIAPSEQKAELEPAGQKELHCPGGPASHSAVASRGVPMAPFGGFLAVKVAPPYPPRVWCAPDTGLRSFVSGAHARPRGGSEGGGPVDVKASSLPSLLRWISSLWAAGSLLSSHVLFSVYLCLIPLPGGIHRECGSPCPEKSLSIGLFRKLA